MAYYPFLISILRCLRLSSSSSTPQLIKWIFTSLFILLNREFSSRSGFSLSSWASIFTPISPYISWNISTSLGVTRVTAYPSEPLRAVLPTRCTQSAMVLGMLQLMTRLTSAISSPREVRSVVTSTRACPLLKAERLATRWLFFMKECSWVAGTSSLCRVSQMSVHSLQVFTKTMVLWRGLPLRSASRQPGLSCSVVKMQLWTSVLTVFLPSKVENFTKSSRTFSSCFSRLPSKFSSIVAVASNACLSAGIAPMMLLMLGSTFSSNSLSASSSTRISTRFSSSTNFSDFSSISASLPGVATTTCGYFSSWSYCMRQLTPPTISACRRLTPCPKTLICSWICMASSRLGATMTAKMLVGSLASSLTSGSPKAAVLPEPVCELMMTLLPCRMGGIVRAWMGVGVWYLIFSQVESTQLDSFSLLNELIQYQIASGRPEWDDWRGPVAGEVDRLDVAIGSVGTVGALELRLRLQLRCFMLGGSRAAVVNKRVSYVSAFLLVLGITAFCWRLFLECPAFYSVLLLFTCSSEDYPVRNPDIFLLAVLLDHAVSLIKPTCLLQHPLQLHSESPLLHSSSYQFHNILYEC